MNQNTVKKFLFSLMAVVIVTGSGSIFAAYTHELYPNIWGNNRSAVLYTVQSTFDATTKTQIVTAMNEWNAALPFPFLYKSSTETTLSSPSKNNINTITKFAYGADSFTGEHIPYTQADGIVNESDIRINTSHPWANSKQPNFIDIQSTFTHEFGHAIRVGHSTATLDTMYGTTMMDTDHRRTITAADDEAANASYDRWVP